VVRRTLVAIRLNLILVVMPEKRLRSGVYRPDPGVESLELNAFLGGKAAEKQLDELKALLSALPA